MSVDVHEVFPVVFAAKPAVVAIAAARFYPNRLPQIERLPSITFRRAPGGPISRLNGTTPLRRAVYTVTGWSSASQIEADQLAQAARTCFPITNTVLGDWLVGVMKMVLDTAEDELPQIPQDGSDSPIYGASFDVFTVYQPYP